MIIKALQTKDKCQDNAKRTGNRCTKNACVVVIHRELSSETRKRLCKDHAHDVMIEHIYNLQKEHKELQEQVDSLLDHAPKVIQKIHNEIYK